MEKETEQKKPNLVLGLDISTSCIGISLVEDNGTDTPNIIKITHIVPKIPNKIKGIEALILRKEIFENEFLNALKDSGITTCVIESPLNHATGNSNAQTVAQLLQFNGLLSEAVYRVLGLVPEYVSSYDARMLSFPTLLSLRKFNKKGELYDIKHYKKAIKENHLVLFGRQTTKKTLRKDMFISSPATSRSQQMTTVSQHLPPSRSTAEISTSLNPTKAWKEQP